MFAFHYYRICENQHFPMTIIHFGRNLELKGVGKTTRVSLVRGSCEQKQTSSICSLLKTIFVWHKHFCQKSYIFHETMDQTSIKSCYLHC